MGLALATILGKLIRRALSIRIKSNAFGIISLFMTALVDSQGLSANAPAPQIHGKGMLLQTKEEWQKIQESWYRVVKVQPNKIGAARIKAEMERNGLTPLEFPVAKSHEEEFLIGGKEFESDEGTLAEALPSSVDNSILPSFPPIGNQGLERSCVAWASTYYQATHEIGLMNGTNNKTSSAGILSPKWTYNMINGGGDNGSYIPDSYVLLSQNGAVPMNKFPYDGNFLQWDLNPQDWITAMHYRTNTTKYLPGLGGSEPQNLTRIKHALNNGHVLTIGTFADSWVMTTIQENPASANLYVGQQAISYVNGTDGGHCITIVGYDDNVWIDVNGNGQVDPGETGAFLLANSWSPTWGNQGFIWIAYDAFLAASDVPDGPNEGRVPAADGTNSTAIYSTAKAHNYSPSIIAQFELCQSQRDQIKVTGGISPQTQTVPVRYFASGAIVYQGGPYEFDGMSSCTPLNGTFALDLSGLIPMNTADERFYLMVNDNMSGNPTTLESFTLIDLVNEKTIPFNQVPQTVDNGKITNFIDYTVNPAVTRSVAKPLAISVTAPMNGTTVHGMIPIVAKASNNAIEQVDFYIDTKSVATETNAPYLVYFDTTKLLNGKHRVTAVAKDTSGKQVTASIIVKVQN